MFRLFLRLSLRSLRNKMMIWAFAFTLCIFVIFFIVTSIVTKSIQDETQSNIQQILKPYSKEIDVVMENAKRYIANKVIDYSIFNGSGTELSNLQLMERLGNSLEEDLSIYSGTDAIFILCRDNMVFVQNYNESYVKNQKVSDFLQRVLKSRNSKTNLFQQGFQYLSIDNDQYFYIALNSPEGIFGCWFSFDALLSEINRAGISGLKLATFTDSQNNVLYSADYESDENENPKDILFISEALMNSDISLTALLDKDTVFSSSNQLKNVQYLTIAVALILLGVYIGILRKIVIAPLTRLASAIDSINAGKTASLEIDRNEDLEIAEIYSVLNSKIVEIESLKNRMYEDNITRQNIRLQMYQLQIKPHFFLNILNNILSLARLNEYQKVKNMILNLSKHLRYILYNMRFVTLEEELEYTRNYVNIINSMREHKCIYEERVEEELLDYEIPILIIQIFVENAMKHSVAADDDLKIIVAIREHTENEKTYMLVKIDDNGGGFNPQFISAINGGEKTVRTGEGGIGIENVLQRLQLFYSGDGNISFSNNDQGGAGVEIKIPVEQPKKEAGL